MKNSTDIWDRLAEVLEADNLEEVANKLGLNASTLRGRKARESVPYEQIVQSLDVYEIAYVLKNKKFNKAIDVSELYEHSDFEETNLVEFERNLDELTQAIEQGPYSRAFKIRLVAALLRIAGENLEDLQKKVWHSVLKEN